MIVHEDHHVPIVAVNLWYHVGSKNERPGRTGFAHLFEHLMFEGSEHHNGGYFPPLQQAGALLNGSTNTDRTNYWEVVPTSALDLALWMESDRMGYLLPALTRERFETQRDVVLNERRQNYENRPYGMAMMALSAALFPPDHPYHWLTIGAAEDIRAMEFEDVQAFFRTVLPSGERVAGAGGRHRHRARVRARRAVLRRHSRRRRNREPVDADASAAARDPARARGSRRAAAAVHGVAFAGDVRRRRRRSGPRWPICSPTARRRVSIARSSTTNASRSTCRRIQHSRELSSFFLLAATAAPGHSLTDIAALIDERIQGLADEGPTDDEMERGLAQAEAHFMYRLQTVGGFGGKSDQLNAYNVFRGDPDFFADDLARYRRATREIGPRRRARLPRVRSPRRC